MTAHPNPDRTSEHPSFPTLEDERLDRSQRRLENWLRWGPYLSERQWGTVREDYSQGGGGDNPWSYLTHDHARSRAYRWGEDGLMGICDRECRLCFSFALWNGRDPILKERLFGLTGPEGNHGEDVKELYYYLDSTPTHSYMKALYKYPQAKFPYEQLTHENRHRGRHAPEFELLDSSVFDEDRYFDVQAEYAKASPDDILIRLTIDNRGPQPAVLHALPQLWFRNVWVWQSTDELCTTRPSLRLSDGVIIARHDTLGEHLFTVDQAGDDQWAWLFTDNETNPKRHPGAPSAGEHFKDAFHEYVVGGATHAVNPSQRGTKAAAYLLMVIPAGGRRVLKMRLTRETVLPPDARTPGGKPRPKIFRERAFNDFEEIFEARIRDAQEYYDSRIEPIHSPERSQIIRQAYAGLLWTKQFYHYVVSTWLSGDPAWPANGEARRKGRNSDWKHLFNRDIISMPDKWEYPWYAAWDSAFHMIPMAHLDIGFAKEQLLLFLREWYMHPNGQIPAYEWQLSDVNPPVHAWAVWHVYKTSGPVGGRDKEFLARCFQKLTVNFTWWVNRKDPQGRNIFAGGFLGLDNIGVFDRSKPLPGGYLEQADGTAWMAFYCAAMLRIALELAEDSVAYADMASKFFEHYVAIAEAMNSLDGSGLWDEADGFYYDHLYVDNRSIPMRVRSMVGLIPLLTGVIIDDAVISKLDGFRKRTAWFLANRQTHLSKHMTYMEHVDEQETGRTNRAFLAIPSQDRFRKLLSVMLDEKEFLSPFGIRSLSAVHRDAPFVFDFGGQRNEVRYVPGESDSGLFGGNSNWRGPIWFPLNFLLIQALKRYHTFYGDSFQVECPTGSGKMMSLRQVALELERRLISIFEPSQQGRRPAHGEEPRYSKDPHWRDLVLFYEYFHADTGLGLGASHQTGWTSLVATMLHSQARNGRGRADSGL